METYLSMMTPGPTATPARATVLVVDDEPRNRLLVRACLEPAYRVLEAVDGADGLAVLAREPVDTVLLDVLMPGRNGYEICAEIKRQHSGILLPVVLLTALSDQDSRNEGLQAGADDYLTKPIDRRELLLRVQGMVKLRSQQEQIHRQVAELRTLQALKDDLFTLVVHDLRNPLASILGLLDLMGDGITREPDQALEDLGQVKVCAWRLRELIDDVIRVRELEEGRLALEARRQDLGEVARRAVATVQSAARLARVEIDLQTRGDIHAEVDARLLQRAMENLLGNAVKYSTAGDRIEFTVACGEEHVTLEVADLGPGVPDSLKAKVFDKFSTAEVRRVQNRRGFGLGLYHVMLVARAHLGSVHVRDRPGGGSIFRVRVPVVLPSEASTFA
jgi:two-component system sensor histidine kinase/response regulator